MADKDLGSIHTVEEEINDTPAVIEESKEERTTAKAWLCIAVSETYILIRSAVDTNTTNITDLHTQFLTMSFGAPFW